MKSSPVTSFADYIRKNDIFFIYLVPTSDGVSCYVICRLYRWKWHNLVPTSDGVPVLDYKSISVLLKIFHCTSIERSQTFFHNNDDSCLIHVYVYNKHTEVNQLTFIHIYVYRDLVERSNHPQNSLTKTQIYQLLGLPVLTYPFEWAKDVANVS